MIRRRSRNGSPSCGWSSAAFLGARRRRRKIRPSRVSCAASSLRDAHVLSIAAGWGGGRIAACPRVPGRRAATRFPGRFPRRLPGRCIRPSSAAPEGLTMLALPKRACLAPGCHALVRRGRCAAHEVARPSRWAGRQAEGGTRTERGYGSAWERLRARVGREETSCRLCGSPDPRWLCDHIRAKSMGGTDERGNLRRLCRRCEGGKTSSEGKAQLSAKRLRSKLLEQHYSKANK